MNETVESSFTVDCWIAERHIGSFMVTIEAPQLMTAAITVRIPFVRHSATFTADAEVTA